jgi:hypothetical protein
MVEPLDSCILEAVCYLTRYIQPVLLASEDEVRRPPPAAWPTWTRRAEYRA